MPHPRTNKEERDQVKKRVARQYSPSSKDTLKAISVRLPNAPIGYKEDMETVVGRAKREDRSLFGKPGSKGNEKYGKRSKNVGRVIYKVGGYGR